MEHRILKNLLTFVLVLALTIGTIAALSMATAAKTETASARYSQQIRESQESAVTELSAAIPENGLSPAASVGAFALILLIPAGGLYLFRRSQRKGKKQMPQGKRRYSPRADMAFAGSTSVKRV